MDSTTSVSKGVFVFKNGCKSNHPKGRARKNQKEDETTENIYSSELWYQSYKDMWNSLERKIKKLNNEMFSKIQSNLLLFVKDCYKHNVTEIPTATILMGINMPDHVVQFSTLSEKIKETISPHVAILHAEDCSSIKLLVENMVSQYVNDKESDDSDNEDTVVIRKQLCTFSLLNSWYNQKYMAPSTSSKYVNKRQKPDIEKENLVVIIPEFESFEEAVLRDFILIVSSYMNVLPFVTIFGVATSLATVHRTLPYQVTSKMKIQVFSSQSSAEYLNSILNNVLISESCPFHLGGKTFTLFTDIFLFYDFSVKGFIQNFKFAMLEHYSYGNAMSLCTKVEYIDEILASFDHADLENVRRLMSFRKYVESKDFATRIKLLEDDKYFKTELKNCLIDLHEFIYRFHILLKCLHQLVFELPGAPLGKQFREIYAIAMTENLVKTDEYKQSIQLLNFLSKDQLLTKLLIIYNILKTSIQHEEDEILEEAYSIVDNFQIELKNVDLLAQVEEIEKEPKVLTENLNRAKLKEELLKMSKDKKHFNKYEKIRDTNLKILSDFFGKHLILPTTKPFYEIFFFNNTNSIRSHVVGSHRAAIHSALNNPHCYLQCDCCKLPNDLTILPVLPDISIIYKLHLECGKFINMYDWLQAFVSIVDPTENEEEEERNVDPKLQARFAHAVAELEFLGFIKSSKRKTDHVQRLTWGGC